MGELINPPKQKNAPESFPSSPNTKNSEKNCQEILNRERTSSSLKMLKFDF